MKDGVGECLLRALLDQAVCPCGTGWFFELAGRNKGPPVSHQLGQRAAVTVGAHPVPLPPGHWQPAHWKAMNVGPLLAMPSFLVRRSGTVGNIISKTATEQSILEIASRTRQNQRQQPSFQCEASELLRWAAPVPLSPPHPSQPVREGEVERTR